MLARVSPWLGPGLATASYLLGSVCFGLVEARRRGFDLRTTGSGNVGATNVGRAFGKGVGRRVLLLDALKGLAPAGAAHALLGPADPWTAATGFAAVFGHCYPLWFRFRGGKGAATAAGVPLGVVPAAGGAAALTFVVLKKATRRASVGSLAGAAVGLGVTFAWTGSPTHAATAMAAAIFALVVWRHRANVVRLMRGEEPPG